MRKRHHVWVSVLVLAFTGLAASAQELSYPQYAGYVNDYADLISPGHEEWIANLSSELEQKTTAQIAVLTVRTTRPLEIEDYAWNLFERWGIGQKGEDNGVLLLVASEDRRLRIESGYGLEGALPDLACDQIIRNTIAPHFREDRYSEGIVAGVAAIAAAVAKEYGVQLSSLEGTPVRVSQQRRTPGAGLLGLIVPLFIFLLLLRMRLGLLGLFLLAPGRRSGGFWYGSGVGGMKGGFGGGFGGFGGGLSGGGGASGSW